MRRAASIAPALAALALAGCGAEGTGGESVSGDVLRVYSSQPLRGPQGPHGQAIVRGQRLALEQARGRAGRWRIDYRALNDADPATGTWEPGLVSANARRAAQDEKTIAYLGEMGTGASAVAIPILNETGILELSPTDSVIGFTREAGANPGEPEKYYPTRERNFARLAPPDHVQAAALLSLMQDAEVSRVFVAHDQNLYGHGVARAVLRGARTRGIEVAELRALDLENAEPAQVAAEVGESRAGAFLYAGEAVPGVPALYDAVARAAPRARLLGTYTQANEAFARAVAAGTSVVATAPWLDLDDYPAAARRAARRYERRHGEPMPAPALYGYESMALVLDAIRRAGESGNDRGRVIDEVMETRNRSSVLGSYSVDANGDSTIRVYGAYRVRDGELSFLRVLDPLGA